MAMNPWERKKEIARYRYTIPDYKMGQPVNLTGFLSELHDIQLKCIDEAVEKSDLKEAKEVIDHIKAKL